MERMGMRLQGGRDWSTRSQIGVMDGQRASEPETATGVVQSCPKHALFYDIECAARCEKQDERKVSDVKEDGKERAAGGVGRRCAAIARARANPLADLSLIVPNGPSIDNAGLTVIVLKWTWQNKPGC
ncbi:hypothetical protein M8818_004719 [Zalaria obscura]|uniref:Uncharacterized protein n=1 Tax=Zalaria obscura TaxID=2024903 RepID=A0ACC3SGB4_9PEZI